MKTTEELIKDAEGCERYLGVDNQGSYKSKAEMADLIYEMKEKLIELNITNLVSKKISIIIDDPLKSGGLVKPDDFINPDNIIKSITDK